MSVPRPEYPRPQFVRSDWLCLNGEWQFEIDSGDSGKERGLLDKELSGTITVPFCPESSLSGVGNVDFMPCVWYRRTVTIPTDWSGRNLLIHFGAVDYDATVWVNGVEAGRHRGGFTPFTVNAGVIIKANREITIVVRARDDSKKGQPRGKQSPTYPSNGCLYTRTTGIWQTVWLEPAPDIAFKRPRITPDLANSRFRLDLPVTKNRAGTVIRAVLKDTDGIVSSADVRADLDFAPQLDLVIPEDRIHLWSSATPHLYDIDLQIVDREGQVLDQATSYAGLRSVSLDGYKVRINGKSVFQRLILDQGYYPDGVMTAPTDEALVADIEMSIAAGYNGARLHQKVFEERFLYHADRLGYLVWGEFGDWGMSEDGVDGDRKVAGATYITQWLEAIERDYSHPSIVGWCGLNETHQRITDKISVLDDVTRGIFLAAKALDTSRPVLDTSGYSHRVPESDVYDSHDYIVESNFADGITRFKDRHADLGSGKAWTNDEGPNPVSVSYNGQPYFVSEFGGFKWVGADDDAPGGSTWGYGSAPENIEQFYTRFEAVCSTLLDNPYMFGYCYTQLTDIYPEENGIYTFSRKAKFDLERLRAIQSRPAGVELEE